ncbi:MAG: dehypoxanthine futalosine cyclase [Planctomycetes bacterium]|nr:dehypoxanthine futalosine cyclase [Planctomycetota bacterium]
MSNHDVTGILGKAVAGTRITPEEGLALLERGELNELGRAALAVRERLHPERVATFIIDRNVNYTNACVADCDFCNFYRRPNESDVYVLPRELLYRKIDELVAIGGTQVLMQGGHHPYLTLEWYEELLRDMRARYPKLQIHAFSPSEFTFFSKIFKKPVRELIARFKAAGLDSIPGGGGEILVDRVRKIIAPKKAMSGEWLEVYRQAHAEGLRGSCTMVIGHYETLPERIEHLERLRQLQDETGGLDGVFVAFIVWTMQMKGTRLDGKVPPAGSTEYLRMNAVARLYLDNIRNIQSSWVTQGAKVGQMSFLYGCNDWGGLMMEENVVSQAGTVHHVQIDQMRALSEELGLTLRQRNFHYELIDAAPAAAPAATA